MRGEWFWKLEVIRLNEMQGVHLFLVANFAKSLTWVVNNDGSLNLELNLPNKAVFISGDDQLSNKMN